jgi:hypothetical protein
MSDDQVPTRAELASAYLDGDLEADQRAMVESDADAMAMVESFGRVRAELNSYEPVDDASRSAAVAAALAEFDTRRNVIDDPAAATVPTSGQATVTALHSRRARGHRVLAGVAAAAVVAIVGIAAINASKDNGDNTFSAAGSSEQTAEVPQIKIAADPAAADASGTAAPPAGAAASIESAATSLPAINSKDELQAFAAGFSSAATAPAPAATTAAAAIPNAENNDARTACVTSEETVLGEIVYQGTPALAVRDDTTGAVQAIATADCAVLETAP